jgi:hypothetical protein
MNGEFARFVEMLADAEIPFSTRIERNNANDYTSYPAIFVKFKIGDDDVEAHFTNGQFQGFNKA